jgi:hypothetical protein|tara:strand:- start:3727 stop:4860 length:1134 start_codon:yes stop_codon:yes gene_type:complete
MARTIFDKLHLSSTTDGDWRIHDLHGLSRLSPFLHIGSNQISGVTLDGYYNCPTLAQFRVVVREIRPKPAPSPLNRGKGGEAQIQVREELTSGTPKWNKNLACPNLFDLDTRNLYFGQLNQNPKHAYYKVGQESDPAWDSDNPGPEGRSVKGMPVRLQQVHFKAYNPDECEKNAAASGTEFSAYFLVSNPVGLSPSSPPPSVTINSDFDLQRNGKVVYWTYNRWTLDGKEDTAEIDWTKRLVVGQEDASTELLNKLTDALTKNGGVASGGEEKCLPRLVTHVYATQCGLKYNYVELSKAKGEDSVTWTAGVEDIIDFTDCEDGSCSASSTDGESCSQSSDSQSCASYTYTSAYPSSYPGGGQIGCPRDYCPGMEPGA